MGDKVPEKVDAYIEPRRNFPLFLKKHQMPIVSILTIGIVATVLCSNILLRQAVWKGVDSAVHSYAEAKDKTYQTTYQEYENVGFSIAEANHHVSNSVLIDIAEIKKTAKLEILRVQDTEFIIENAEDNDENITAWLQVSGNGVFTIDLQTAQFLTNQEKKSVIIKLPKPQLTECTLDEGSIEKLLFKNQIFQNETPREGESLADKQTKEAYARIKDEFMTNPIYVKSAEQSAENILCSWIKELNQDIPELTVEIKFVDY